MCLLLIFFILFDVPRLLSRALQLELIFNTFLFIPSDGVSRVFLSLLLFCSILFCICAMSVRKLLIFHRLYHVLTVTAATAAAAVIYLYVRYVQHTRSHRNLYRN